MNLSYNWLKQYMPIDLEPQKLSEILTSIGLEVGGYDSFQSVKGGLEGLVIGEVLTCAPHPDSDHLSLTTVDLGDGNPTPIVCGAKNVATGQKVVVATIGTTLYQGNESFAIKKSKIRGAESMGMICAEDEIGIGTSHDGIMVLPKEVPAGTLAKNYFNIEDDIVFEVDLTPNRIDAGSHVGIARDVAAYLKQKQDIEYHLPSVDSFKVDNHNLDIKVTLENPEACTRYAGISLTGLKVKESPGWLKNRLKAIGLNPINNVVDVTNFVLHELGQPLHAFDAKQIAGNKVIVKTLPETTPFLTLDGQERKLSQTDLMICNQDEGMCIAGVFGGIKSGVTEATSSIFLESACFNPVYVRKTARRHGLNTDASFRFERGVDPNSTIYALKRAALLIKEVAGGAISSEVVDIYPSPVADFEVNLRMSQIERLIGEKLPKTTVAKILNSLEIKIEKDLGDSLLVRVPPYRVDVRREADVIEEVLRIYGYNTVLISKQVNAAITYAPKPDPNVLKELISNQLSSVGFNEMMANSLTKSGYYEPLQTLPKEHSVHIVNPLSQDLDCLRQTLLFGFLEAIAFNTNRQYADLKLFEFGNTYFFNASQESGNPLDRYSQNEKLALAVTGNRSPESWVTKQEKVSFFYLKKRVEQVFERLGVDLNKLEFTHFSNELFSDGFVWEYQKNNLGRIGLLQRKVAKEFELKNEVFYAELDWERLLKTTRNFKVEYSELPKYPEVRRDLSLLLDSKITFEELKIEAYKQERKLLKAVSLFDVYEGDKLGAGKKSYALSFILQDESKTLTDKQIDKIMENLIKNFESKFGAKLR
ncbi:MAG: phenylalanine--tRNA ligase subunit beta [Salinivirgaceae bacterium]|nr:phenylalanine--tRNA ligase subunit beta [Salinivirgaceae bacterium]